MSLDSFASQREDRTFQSPNASHHADANERSDAFLAHVASDQFPCVGAKAALARGAIETHEFSALASDRSDRCLLGQLHAFGGKLRNRASDDSTVYSFVAIFDDLELMSEQEFETKLWELLQRLHHLDATQGIPWAKAISTNTASSKFSLSLGGEAFFIIGLHPNASRIGRRFPRPTLVFNSHEQFEELREDGRYAKMQKATRARDRELQGSINPNLADFGSASEARQYSGRKVEANWKCPFQVETVAATS